MANKVKFGFKNCYYAPITVSAGGEVSYGTPVALNGAVSMSLSASGDTTEFYADNSLYFSDVNNNYVLKLIDAWSGSDVDINSDGVTDYISVNRNYSSEPGVDYSESFDVTVNGNTYTHEFYCYDLETYF